MVDAFQVTVVALGLAALGLLLLLLRRRPSADAAVGAQVVALQQSVEGLARALAQLEERTRPLPESLGRLAQVQQASLQWPKVAEKVTVVESKLPVLDQVRAGVDQIRGYFASERGRGKVGEQAVEEILAGLPDDAWRRQVALSTGRVDFAAVMPNGTLVPIDAKTSGTEDATKADDALRRLAALPADAPEGERRRWADEAERSSRACRTRVLGQAGKIASYAGARENVLAVVVQAVPDVVFDHLDAETRRDASAQNVELVPYSLLSPFVSALRRQNTHTREDVHRIAQNLAGARTLLGEVEQVVQNKLDRSATMLENAIAELREKVRALDALLRADGAAAAGGQARLD